MQKEQRPASPRFRNSCKFSPCNHNAGTANQRHNPKQAFSTRTVDNNVIKGLGYSQNRRVSGQRLCLLFSQISISADYGVPAFSKAGTFFLLRYLKKRQRNVRCIIEVFLKISRNFFRTKGENMSVCYIEGKFFAPPICRNFVRWIVEKAFGAKAQASPLQSQNFSDKPRKSVRWLYREPSARPKTF